MNNHDDIRGRLDGLLTAEEELKTAKQQVDNQKHELIAELLARGMTECFTLNMNAVRRAVGYDERGKSNMHHRALRK